MVHFILLCSLTYKLIFAVNEIETIDHLKQLSKDWMQAWMDNNTARLEAVLAPEFRLITGESWIMPRQQWLEAVPRYKCDAFQYEEQEVRLYGNTAVMQSRSTQRATFNGNDRSGHFLITDVWVQQPDGAWQVVHRHSSYKKA